VSTDRHGERQWNLSDFGTHVCVCYSEESADRVGRAFHDAQRFAKLAGEAKDMVKRYPLPIHRNDWLRRYDAAKGEA